MPIAHDLYKLYHKHLAPREAVRAIENALKRLPLELKLEGINVGNEIEWIKEKIAAFRESDAGRNDGLFPGYKPPYPATWFNKSRYLDDQGEWYGTNGQVTKGEQRVIDNRANLIDDLGDLLSERVGRSGEVVQGGNPQGRFKALAKGV